MNFFAVQARLNLLVSRSLLLLSAIACGHAEAPIADSPDAVVVWGVSQFFWGQELLVVERDGTARYDFRPAEHGKSGRSVHNSVRLPQSEVERVHADLVAHQVCGLTSKRNGIPDEGMPTLRVRFPDLSCTVSLWDGEWSGNPDAHACLDAVDRMRQATRQK